MTAATPMLIDTIIGGGPAGQARTIDGASVWLDEIRFTTPRDTEKIPAGAAIFKFDTLPAAPPFETVEQLDFEPLAEELIGSRPAEMETYRLGNARITVPPPPDWKRSIGQIPPWRRAVAAGQVDHLPFVNGAVFCWATNEPSPAGSANVYLFRQSFNIQQHGDIARATLRLATNGDPIEISINEHTVQLPTKVNFGMATWDITRLLQPDVNLIAIKLSERPRSTEVGYGVAFHIDLLRRTKPIEPPQIKSTEALLTSKSGDRLWGNVHDVTAEGITLDSAYGRYRLKWEQCNGVVFPTGWRIEQPQKKNAPKPPEPPVYGLPLSSAPVLLQDCMLLTENRRTTARPSYSRDGKLFFESGDGKPFSMPIAEVLGIYPPQPLDNQFVQPRPEAALLYCRLQTTRGEQVTGLLRQLRGSNVVLETESGNFLELKTRWLASIYFPYHAARPKGPAARIAILPLAAGSEGYGVAYNNDARRVSSAIFGLGDEPEKLAAEQMTTDQFTTTNFPAAIYIDPVGEYMHTLSQPGDAQEALMSYIMQGGRLIVLARGGAFRTAVRNENGQMRRLPADMVKPNVTGELGVSFARPVATPPEGVTPFNHPPNDGRIMSFQRAGQLPAGLLGLTRQVRLGSMLSAPFYPMVATAPGAIALYDLRDDSGRVFGPAMQAVPKGRGMVIVIDHLLWESEIDDTSFIDRELPKLLRWALNPEK